MRDCTQIVNNTQGPGFILRPDHHMISRINPKTSLTSDEQHCPELWSDTWCPEVILKILQNPRHRRNPRTSASSEMVSPKTHDIWVWCVQKAPNTVPLKTNAAFNTWRHKHENTMKVNSSFHPSAGKRGISFYQKWMVGRISQHSRSLVASSLTCGIPPGRHPAPMLCCYTREYSETEVHLTFP